MRQKVGRLASERSFFVQTTRQSLAHLGIRTTRALSSNSGAGTSGTTSSRPLSSSSNAAMVQPIHHHPHPATHSPPTHIQGNPSIPTVVNRRLITQQFEGGKLADGTIFRRPLPAPAIELSSPEGTLLFAEALQEGTAKCFFRLMEQLHTQNEPEYCGLATLVTVLNALNVDPHRRWKGVWRFYSEELLECCEPLTNVKKVGIDFDKLGGLAKCNGLHVEAVRASETSLDTFRNVILEASQTEDSSLVLAYSRKVLGQTGLGHYSPMGAYHARSDHLLILDCARFKYRPHWVSVPLMFEAMSQIDVDTGKTRGYMKMSPVYHIGPPPAAHVLALSMNPRLVPDQPVSDIAQSLMTDFQGIAKSSTSAKQFLAQAATALEKVFRMELKGHGCSTPARKSRIAAQLDSVPSFDDEDGELATNHERQLQRKAVVMCLEQSFLSRLLEHRIDIKDEVLGWVRPADAAGELAVEISFTQPQLHEVLRDQYMKDTEHVHMPGCDMIH